MNEERASAPKDVADRAAAAREEFESLKAEAAAAAEEARKDKETKAKEALGGVKESDIGVAISRGTFNPAVVGALAGGDKLSGIEEHTKKGAKHLDNIDRKIDQLGLDYEP